jgi:quinol monooxygenase YgiN
MPEPINVVATITAKPGKEAETRKLLLKLVEETHKEAGCLTYMLHEAKGNPRAFVFIEEWESEAALNEHLQSKHVAAAMTRKDELLESVDIVPLVSL